MPRQVAKKMRKEISRQGRAEIFTPETLPTPPERKLTPTKKMLYIEKISKREEKHPNIEKGFKKTAKRTNPGANLPPDYSPPADAHKEGKRWIKTLNKQTQTNRKIFVKRQMKKI